MPGCSWRGHLRGVHIHYCLGVLGGDTCEGYIFITARVFLKGTPAMGRYGFHYCPGVLGGDTYDGSFIGLDDVSLLSIHEPQSLDDNMANENVPAPAPTRSDEQILPFAAWVPIGKSNFVLDLQKNPIFQISFWNTLTYEVKTGAYSFQLDETRFVLDANLLREDLEITPIDQAHQFVSPLSDDAIMDFVNELVYTEEIYFVLRMAVNNLPRYPVLQMLWGIITSTNVDYVELMWEEFIQAVQTFLMDKANLSTAP
ncbi:hypothetical protein Tco_0153433 [Tanacetum coccineum]